MKALILTQLLDKSYKVLVIGAGISGQAAAQLLLSKSMKVALYDDNPSVNLPESLCKNANLCLHLGEKNYTITQDINAVILSPGVPPEHPLVRQAKNLDLLILSEIDLAYLFLPNLKIIGVSGTNGKSTTTMMIQTIFEQAGKSTLAGGNIGMPPCQMLVENRLNTVEFLVLELSSFQLETIVCTKLDAALLINITPDHLDRYQILPNYVAAKLKIAALLKSAAPLVINPNLAGYFAHNRPPVLTCFEANPQVDPSSHNPENVAAAAAVASYFGIDNEQISAGIAAFKPLPHRFERVGTRAGVEFINDSKATTVASVLDALKNVSSPIHLILGGIAKGESFSALSAHLHKNIVTYYVYGHSKDQICSDLVGNSLSVHANLAECMSQAMTNASPGHTILLSPACASYDQFNNFAERGDTFKKIFFDALR